MKYEIGKEYAAYDLLITSPPPIGTVLRSINGVLLRIDSGWTDGFSTNLPLDLEKSYLVVHVP